MAAGIGGHDHADLAVDQPGYKMGSGSGDAGHFQVFDGIPPGLEAGDIRRRAAASVFLRSTVQPAM